MLSFLFILTFTFRAKSYNFVLSSPKYIFSLLSINHILEKYILEKLLILEKCPCLSISLGTLSSYDGIQLRAGSG